jgi:hypothetical protein
MEGMGVRGGRSPRRTMVVADQLQDVGSAGTFEIGGDVNVTQASEPEPEDDAPKPRVRLAFTQRVDAADAPSPLPAARRTIAVPQATPAPSPAVPVSGGVPPPSGAAEYGSGVYDQLSQDRTRTVAIVLGILLLGGMAAYLIIAMGAR